MIIKDGRESQSMPRDLPALASNKLRLILENHDLELGTTFPPRTRKTLEMNGSNRFHSETNLNRFEDDTVRIIFFEFLLRLYLITRKAN